MDTQPCLTSFEKDWIGEQHSLDAYRQARRLLLQGRDSEALAVLEASFPAPAPVVVEELCARILQARGEKAAAAEICRQALLRSPEHTGVATLLGQLHLAEGRGEEATTLFRSVAASPFPTDAALINLGLASALDPTDAPLDCILATSIPPGVPTLYRSCVDSWLRQGFRILSLNAEDELTGLGRAYPEVEFIRARRDAREELGRPCVYVDDMLEILAQRSEPLCGLVNADIFLAPEPDLGAWLRTCAASRMVFGSRADVASHAAPVGRIYNVGFDFFLFPTAWAGDVHTQDVALGTPWWDYLLPACALGQQRRVARVASPVVRHVRHPLNWRLGQGWRNGLRAIRALMPEGAGLLAKGMDLGSHNEGYAQFMAGLGMSLAETLNTLPEPLLFGGLASVRAPFDADKTRFPFPTLLVHCAPEVIENDFGTDSAELRTDFPTQREALD